MPHGETLQVPLDRPAAKAPFRLVLPWDLAGDQHVTVVKRQVSIPRSSTAPLCPSSYSPSCLISPGLGALRVHAYSLGETKLHFA